MLENKYDYKINYSEKTTIPHPTVYYASVTLTLRRGGRTVAVELQNRVIPAVAVEILRWPQGHRTANPYVLQAARVAVEL